MVSSKSNKKEGRSFPFPPLSFSLTPFFSLTSLPDPTPLPLQSCPPPPLPPIPPLPPPPRELLGYSFPLFGLPPPESKEGEEERSGTESGQSPRIPGRRDCLENIWGGYWGMLGREVEEWRKGGPFPGKD